MRAVVFASRLSPCRDYSMPEPVPGEALIRVSLAGVCTTDLEIVKGYQQFQGVLGHEFVGVVEAVNGPQQDIIGKRVVGEINLACGDCDLCRQGFSKHCRNRRVLGIRNKDGAMADYITLPVENLYLVPESVSDETAVFVEPLAAAFAIVDQVAIGSDDKVLVLGDGKLGLLVAQVVKSITSNVTMAGNHLSKLALAEKFGAQTVLVDKMTPTKEFDVVVDATGSPLGLKIALQQVRPLGTVILKSTVEEEAHLNLASAVVNEVTIIGSRCGPFAPALAALAEGKVSVDSLIDTVYPAEQALVALARAGSRGALKVLLDFRTGREA